MVMRTTFPFLVNLANYVTIPIFRRAAQSGARMAGYARQSVERLKQHSLKQDDREFKPTLFTKMFNAGENGLTDFEIMLEAGGYITAGSDTTAISLTYLIWAVCGHPEVQKRLVAEVGTLPDDFDDSHARALPYLSQVIDETLRMYSAVPGALPRAVPPSGAVLAGYHFPGGVTVSSQAYTLHRDPVVFSDPNR
jgi:cytochrome P450